MIPYDFLLRMFCPLYSLPCYFSLSRAFLILRNLFATLYIECTLYIESSGLSISHDLGKCLLLLPSYLFPFSLKTASSIKLL